MKAKLSLLLTVCLMLVACDSPVIESTNKNSDKASNVFLRFSLYGQEDFTREASALTDQCSRLSVVIFKTDGTKVKSATQKAGDTGFGIVNVALTSGTYKVVAVAHNGDGTATITSPEKVTFPNNKMTDTFSCCEELTVTDDIPLEKEIQMQRVVAMVRLTLTSDPPDDVQQMKFYYTGGSSTLNPTTGYGCVQSKQAEYRSAVVDGSRVNIYELYTAPHELNDVLKLTITALGSDGTALNEWTMEDVPVTRNKITAWTGNLFGGGGGDTPSDGGITLTLDAEWDGTLNYSW